MLAPWKENCDKPRQHIKKQRYHFADTHPYSESYGFPSSHVWMWDLDLKHGWEPKNWCFQTVGLEKTLQSSLDSKEIKLVNVKGNQSWIIIHWEDWCWSWNSNTLPTWCKESTHWKRPWCWERLRAWREEGDRGWGGWMASSAQWTWVWANSRKWWRTEKPGMLQFMGLQTVGHD